MEPPGILKPAHEVSYLLKLSSVRLKIVILASPTENLVLLCRMFSF